MTDVLPLPAGAAYVWNEWSVCFEFLYALIVALCVAWIKDLHEQLLQPCQLRPLFYSCTRDVLISTEIVPTDSVRSFSGCYVLTVSVFSQRMIFSHLLGSFSGFCFDLFLFLPPNFFVNLTLSDVLVSCFVLTSNETGWAPFIELYISVPGSNLFISWKFLPRKFRMDMDTPRRLYPQLCHQSQPFHMYYYLRASHLRLNQPHK